MLQNLTWPLKDLLGFHRGESKCGVVPKDGFHVKKKANFYQQFDIRNRYTI